MTRHHVLRNGRHGRSVRDRHRKIIATNQPPCHICGRPIDYDAHHYDPESFTIDHITPIAKGGSDTLDNLAPAHRSCNRAKGASTPAPPITYTTSRTW